MLLVRQHDNRPPARTITLAPAVPGPGPKLPLGTPAGPENAPEASFAAIPGTVRTVAYASDPHGGPAWGLRELRIRDGQTCVQIGRVADRTIDYGLLGPDAASVEFVRADGVHVVQPTNGPDGAYVIVRPVSPQPCVLIRGGGRSCSNGGMTQSPSLQSGTITAVRYRDGHVCRLPQATSSEVTQASCPPVGYAAPRQPHITEGTVLSQITVKLLPYAASYCDAGGSAFRVCRPGETPLRGTSDERLVDFSFIARAPADGVTSSYQFEDAYAAAGSKSCPGGGSGGPSDLRARAGQRVTFQDQIPIGCTGLVTGTITYTPNTGPGGTDGGPVAPGHTPGTLPVGRFRFLVP